MPGDHFRGLAAIAGGYESAAPDIGWKQMAAAGNVYRHDYEDVAAEFVWETVQRALPPLRAAIEIELKGGV
jgi:uncharacterized protein with HEPN domain